RSLLEYHPDDPEASVQLGNIYLQGGSRDAKFFRDSKDLAEKLLEKDRKNELAKPLSNEEKVLLQVLLGNAQAGLREYTDSIKQFESALTLDPNNTSGLVSLGVVQAAQKNFPEAEQAFLKARQIDPKNVNAL